MSIKKKTKCILTCQLDSYKNFIWYKGSNKSIIKDLVSIYRNSSLTDKFKLRMNVSLSLVSIYFSNTL